MAWVKSKHCNGEERLAVCSGTQGYGRVQKRLHDESNQPLTSQPLPFQPQAQVNPCQVNSNQFNTVQM